MATIRRVAPGVPVILDAKRGIGATAQQYAREAFERYQADAVTLGLDSLEPCMRCRRQGPDRAVAPPTRAAPTCKRKHSDGGELLRAHRPAGRRKWNRGGQMALVVGATYPQGNRPRARAIAPTLPLLILPASAPGRRRRSNHGARLARPHDREEPIIVSSSRAILYASPGEAFASAARRAALATRDLLQSARESRP